MKIINHIGLSGGKDSTALWGWAINESGYPIESIRGSFADTGNEYQEVYDQIAALNSYGIKRGVAPIEILRPKRYFLELAKWKHRFPSSRARFCTEHLKMKPFQYWVELQQLYGFDVVGHSGVRAAESDERAKLPEWDTDPYTKIKIHRPLLAWSISQIWDAHRRYRLPINPLYLKGRKRVGCKLCCMSSKEDVRQTVLHRPETIAEYSIWEESFENRNRFCGFFARNTVPEAQRTRKIVTKDGIEMMVCDIHDVARWSQTLRGGVQSGFDFMFEEDDDFDGGLTCRSAMGHCE